MTRQLAVLVNPTSGKGRGARLLGPVSERLRQSGAAVDVVVGRDADEAFDRLRDRVAGELDGVVAVGGGMSTRAAVVSFDHWSPLIRWRRVTEAPRSSKVFDSEALLAITRT